MFFISELFYTKSRDYVIQRVGNSFLLYDGRSGKYIKDFRDFRTLQEYIERMSLFNGSLKLGNKAVIEIALPDGWWLCEVIHYSDERDGWNYEIPETRAQEKRIWDALTA